MHAREDEGGRDATVALGDALHAFDGRVLELWRHENSK